MYRILFIYLLLLFTSCQLFESREDWVVKYKDFMLYKPELVSILPEEYTAEDSAVIVDKYIDNWLKNKILLSQSANIIPEQKVLEIKDKVEQYQQDLVSGAVEEQWIKENPPVAPTETEMKDFYNKNPDFFPAKEDLVNYTFINLPIDSAYLARKLLQENTPESLKKLDSISKKYHYSAQLNSKDWTSWEHLKSFIPNYKNNIYLDNKNHFYNLKNDGLLFMLNIINVTRKNSPAPFDYVKNDIKNIIINKRKLTLLSQKKEELYENALYEDEIERK